MTDPLIIALKSSDSAIVLDKNGAGFIKLSGEPKTGLSLQEQVLKIVFEECSSTDWCIKFIKEQGAVK